MGVRWNEIEKARRAEMPERQEQGLSSSSDAMYTNEDQCMTMKMINHTLVSLHPGSPHVTPTPSYYLSWYT